MWWFCRSLWCHPRKTARDTPKKFTLPPEKWPHRPDGGCSTLHADATVIATGVTVTKATGYQPCFRVNTEDKAAQGNQISNDILSRTFQSHREVAFFYLRSVVRVEVLTRAQLVYRTAIWALGCTRAAHVQVDLGMAVPDFHVGFGAGTEHAALGIQVFGQQLDTHAGHSVTFVLRTAVRFALGAARRLIR